MYRACDEGDLIKYLYSHEVQWLFDHGAKEDQMLLVTKGN